MPITAHDSGSICNHFSVLSSIRSPIPILKEKLKEYQSEDFQTQLERQGTVDGHLVDIMFNKCLSVIENAMLTLGDRPLKEYGLP